MKSNLPTNPLAAIIKKAASTLPAETGKVAAQQARLDRRRGDVVIVADVSYSMGGDAWGGRRKIDLLRDAVAAARAHVECKLIAFSGAATEVDTIPEPEANTNLPAGLLAARQHDPGITLVISDGRPDNEAKALEVARTFRGAIDVLYIGPESDAAAIAFMRRLAAAGGGDLRINDLARQLGTQKLLASITALLPHRT